MTEAELIVAPTLTLCSVFRAQAHAHGAAIQKGSHRAANRAYATLRQIALELRRRGASDALGGLVGDSDLSTQLWAARYCLDLSPELSEKALARLAAGDPGPIRLTAEATLDAWRRGALDITA